MKTGPGSKKQPASRDRISQFIGEVGRRRVWRTAIAYAAVVFVLLQLGEIIFPAFGAPDWSLRLLVVTSFLGFPVVLALAWAFDITSHGIQRAPKGDSGRLASDYSGTTMPRLSFLAVVIVTAGGVGWWAFQDTVNSDTPAPSPTAEDGFTQVSLDEAPLQVRSLAVLPLDDFSEEEGGAYFTAGFHEELVSQLSQTGAARVLSRTSVVQYDATGKAMPEIARDLGVEGVVEGSVFRDGNRVRITVQLIHGPTDQHLWANSYDGTLEDAIGLQRTVAQAIAQEIRSELAPQEYWETPGARVASSPRVQDEYMKGRYNQFRASPEALDVAVEHFEAALEEDSTFAPAFAGLAGARLLQGLQTGEAPNPDLLTDPQITEPLQMAFRLDEDSPEAQAVYLTLRETLGGIPDIVLPEGVRVLIDSTAFLEAEFAISGTEFGRQLHRVVVQQGIRTGRRANSSSAQKLLDARRREAASDMETAEVLVRSAIDESPENAEAWDALESLKTRQKDFSGVARVREERMAHNPNSAVGMSSSHDIETRLSQEGSEGFWSWRVEELQARAAEGGKVSPVVMARAYMGLNRAEEALRELAVAVEARDRDLVSLWTDPAWDSVRGDPRFMELLTEIRKPTKRGGPPGF
jgi:TolB-like protein